MGADVKGVRREEDAGAFVGEAKGLGAGEGFIGGRSQFSGVGEREGEGGVAVVSKNEVSKSSNDGSLAEG